MKDFSLFWNIISLCDWSQEGDDSAVLAPVIHSLAKQGDAVIFAFDDQMTELLYRLDTRKLAEQCEQTEGMMSDDSFLYSRCVALVNGEEYYQQALAGNCPNLWTMEFESLLYVPMQAWAALHDNAESHYPHMTPLSYETGSNAEGWA